MVTFGTPTYAGSSSQTTSLAIARPTDLGNGDVLVVAIRSQDGSGTTPWSSAEGFTLITADPNLPASGSRVVGIYARSIVDITEEPAGYTFSGPTGRAVAMAVACHGATEGDLVRVGYNAYGGGRSPVGGVIDMPSADITVPSIGLVLLAAECTSGVSMVPTTIPDGYTVIGNVQSSLDSSTTGSRTAIWLGWREETTTPVVGVRGGYSGGSGTGLYYGAFTGGGDATPPEPEPVVIPEGFRSVAQMLATPGATWAHRGGSGSYPEMSEYAYEQSALRGYGALEFSCGRTSDGVWFGLHDTSLDRTSQVTTGTSAAQMTWAQVQEYQITLNAGGTPRPYYRLTDFMEKYGNTHVVIIDFKYAWSYREELWAILRQYPSKRIIIKFSGPTSFGAEIKRICTQEGWASWGYYYPADVPDALDRTQGNWTILGMDYTAPQEAWDAILAYGKPVAGHICGSVNAVNTAKTKGAHMVQCSGVAVIPAVGPPDNPQQWDAIYASGSRIPVSALRVGTLTVWP